MGIKSRPACRFPFICSESEQPYRNRVKSNCYSLIYSSLSQTELSSKEIPIFKNYPGTHKLKKPSSVNMSGNTPLSDKMLKMLNSQFPLHRKNSNTVSFSVNLVLRTCTFNSNLGPQRNLRCSTYNNFGP